MVVVSNSVNPNGYLEGYDHLTCAFHLGWTIGGIGADSHWCQRLAVEANAVVFDVGYRLAPEHKFPTAIEDSWKALMHVSLSRRTSWWKSVLLRVILTAILHHRLSKIHTASALIQTGYRWVESPQVRTLQLF